MNKRELMWVSVCNADEIPTRGAIKVDLNGRAIALFKTADHHIYALDDQCPHKGGPLSDGIVHDNCVTCPLHNWVISLESGLATGADVGQTNSYKVKVEAGSVMLEIGQTIWLAQA